jgi:hypothetical protein
MAFTHFYRNTLSSCFLFKNPIIKIYQIKIIICFILVPNLTSHSQEETRIEGAWDQSSEDNTWTQKGELTGRLHNNKI